MKSRAETLRYLYGLQQRGMKFGLRNIRALLASAGNPERSFRSIHIAGTNGKGSTASFLASIMMESGYRTGLYTSPHLVRFEERIRINGKMIPVRRLVEYIRELRPAIESARATFFEATTCAAFRYFADEGVDVAVIETGLGGRLDATNTLIPEVSVITSIGLDHMEYLGSTIRSIAREKGGIIKPGVPVVTSSDDPTVLRTLSRLAHRRRARLYRSSRVVPFSVRQGRRGVEAMTLRSRAFTIRNVVPGLAGPHQRLNAQLAIAALDVVLRRAGVRRGYSGVTVASIKRGLQNVVRNAGLRGRFQLIGRRQLCLLDVAHNPAGVRTLVSAIRTLPRRPRIAVFGAMRDKDSLGMLRELSPAIDRIVVVAAATSRAAPPRKLLRYALKAGIPAVSGGSVRRGLAIAQRLAGIPGQVVVTGSHYVVGEALALLMDRKP